ncbi:GNAT family N-acetyltransferase [Arthrobacter sp.]|uniref:GNAT family N-acetyltransferase n=1 Tax=Arthrobacter sp. TaxID=1667 RepID=UPI002810D6B1|nr:GNAT family N-acetyltransferase [Arthrobacter sp.]
MAKTETLTGNVQIRLLSSYDADLLSTAYELNKEHLAPWEPARSADFFTAAGQAAVIAAKLDLYTAGSEIPWVLLDEGRIIGAVTLTGIVRGPFLSAHIGYWVEGASNGRGIASAAVAFAVETAKRDLGLHRLQAATLKHNLASKKALKRSGFEQIGYAPAYLKIAGRWQDHVLYQRLLY